jgi:heat shock protein HtpX
MTLNEMTSKKPFLTISSALILGLTIIVNWFVIAVFLSILFPQSYFVLSILTVFALAGLSLTPAAESVVRLYFGCRRPTREEMAQLEEPWNAVIQACGLANRKYMPELFVSDQPFPNAFAVGTRTVCLTRGLLKTATPDEIAGVLAHEMGHLENGDTKRRMIATVINSAGNIAAMILTGIVIALGFGGQTAGIISRRGDIACMGWFLYLLAFFLKACLWALQWLIQVGFFAVGRKEEFAADDFARKAGFANGLVSFLRKIESLDVQPVGIWAVLTRTHPPVPERIDRLLYGPPEKR